MNSSELREYKREKSKKFNAHLRQLRLKEKENKKIADQEPDNQQPDNQGTAQGKQDELSLQDVMDIFETLDTKMDIIQTKLETIMENKLYETLDTKMDIIQNKLETIIENKLENKLEPNTLLPQFKPIFFA